MAEFTVYAGAASGWDSSSNATGAPDDSYAYASNSYYGPFGGFKYLTLSNFGITDELPANAVIDKVTVSAKVKANSGSSTDEIYMRVYARINGVDQAKSDNSKIVGATVKSVVYTSGDALDPSNLTDALFTARVSAEFVNMTTTKIKRAECDYVSVTVEYHLRIPSVGIEMGCNF